MKCRGLILFLVCVVLCACTQNITPPGGKDDVPPVADSEHDSVSSPASPNDTAYDDKQNDFTLSSLTMEVVVEWEQTDALLSRLPELEELLQTALKESGTFADDITLTINTAGGFTAEALAQGGINAALLPAADYIACEDAALCLAMSNEEVSESVIALSRNDDGWDSRFPTALFEALTATQSGTQFLALCCPDTVFVAPTEEALQAVRDFVAAQEEKNP